MFIAEISKNQMAQYHFIYEKLLKRLMKYQFVNKKGSSYKTTLAITLCRSCYNACIS